MASGGVWFLTGLYCWWCSLSSWPPVLLLVAFVCCLGLRLWCGGSFAAARGHVVRQWLLLAACSGVCWWRQGVARLRHVPCCGGGQGAARAGQACLLLLLLRVARRLVRVVRLLRFCCVLLVFGKEEAVSVGSCCGASGWCSSGGGGGSWKSCCGCGGSIVTKAARAVATCQGREHCGVMASAHRCCLCFARAQLRAAAPNGRRSQSLTGTALCCCLLGPGPALPGICISEGGSRKRRRDGSICKNENELPKLLLFISVRCPCRTCSGSRGRGVSRSCGSPPCRVARFRLWAADHLQDRTHLCRPSGPAPRGECRCRCGSPH